MPDSLKSMNSMPSDDGALLPESGKELPADQALPAQIIPSLQQVVAPGLPVNAMVNPAMHTMADGNLAPTSLQQTNAQQILGEQLSAGQSFRQRYLSGAFGDDGLPITSDHKPEQAQIAANNTSRLPTATLGSDLANASISDDKVMTALPSENRSLSADMTAKQNGTALNHLVDSIQTGVMDTAAKADIQSLHLPIHHPAASSASPGQHSTQPAEPKVVTMQTHFDSSDWSDELSNKVRWITANNLQSAEIKLHPKHLGTIEVKVDVTNDQANIHFVTSSAQVKDALETAAHRLRDMLDTSGLQLSHFGVSDHPQPGGNRNDQGQRFQSSVPVVEQAAASNEESVIHETALPLNSRLVDYYA